MPLLYFLQLLIGVQVDLVGEIAANVVDLFDLAVNRFEELLFV
jgi:hypothetical protein